MVYLYCALFRNNASKPLLHTHKFGGTLQNNNYLGVFLRQPGVLGLQLRAHDILHRAEKREDTKEKETNKASLINCGGVTRAHVTKWAGCLMLDRGNYRGKII